MSTMPAGTGSTGRNGRAGRHSHAPKTAIVPRRIGFRRRVTRECFKSFIPFPNDHWLIGRSPPHPAFGHPLPHRGRGRGEGAFGYSTVSYWELVSHHDST